MKFIKRMEHKIVISYINGKKYTRYYCEKSQEMKIITEILDDKNDIQINNGTDTKSEQPKNDRQSEI